MYMILFRLTLTLVPKGPPSFTVLHAEMLFRVYHLKRWEGLGTRLFSRLWMLLCSIHASVPLVIWPLYWVCTVLTLCVGRSEDFGCCLSFKLWWLLLLSDMGLSTASYSTHKNKAWSHPTAEPQSLQWTLLEHLQVSGYTVDLEIFLFVW